LAPPATREKGAIDNLKGAVFISKTLQVSTFQLSTPPKQAFFKIFEKIPTRINAGVIRV